MTNEEIIELAQTISHGWWLDDDKLVKFAKLVEKAEYKKTQGNIERLCLLYEQACKQRDELMNMQREIVKLYRPSSEA